MNERRSRQTPPVPTPDDRGHLDRARPAPHRQSTGAFGRIAIRDRLAMVVDADRDALDSLMRALEEEGFRAEGFTDPVTAAQAVAHLDPDLVVTDLSGQPGDLQTLFERVHDLDALGGPPILGVAHANGSDLINLAHDRGVTDFIRKPVAWDFFVFRVRQLMRSARILNEAHRIRTGLDIAQRIAQTGSWEWNIEQDEIRWSDQLYSILGYAPGAFVPSFERFLALAPEADRSTLAATMYGLYKGQGEHNITVEQIIRRADGAERLMLCYAEITRSPQGQPRWANGTVQDITERRRTEERIRQLAYYDGLTGLPNRTWFMERLDQCVGTARRHRRLFAVMFLDLDKFKRINDTLGHHAGDELLAAFASRVSQCIRKEDILTRIGPGTEVVLSRLGGDEFCVLLTDLARSEDAGTVAERILAVLAEPFSIAGLETFTSSSIGIAVYPHDGQNADELLKAADVAMYHSKERGRETYHFYDPSMNARAAERLILESELRHAIERHEFVVHYQPIVDARNGALTGLEALVRWQHPARGLLLPAEFVQVAEDSRLLALIGNQVLESVCEHLSGWRDAGHPLVPVSVNLSADHFRRGDLAAALAELLTASGVEPRHLRVEITESVLMKDLDATLSVLERLKQMGVRLALDDFGTGYSSLGHLQRLPIDDLKIDRSFTRGVTEDPDHAAITTAIIDLARRLRRNVIAEGIETDTQVAFLREHGCYLMQGHLFGVPEPAHLVVRRLSPNTATGSGIGHDAPDLVAS